MTPEIRCKIEVIAMVGNFNVAKSKLTGLFEFIIMLIANEYLHEYNTNLFKTTSLLGLSQQDSSQEQSGHLWNRQQQIT